MHRFAIASLAKAVGGMEYSYAVRGDGQQATRPVPARVQRQALSQLAGLLAPEQLAIPDTVVTLLGPRPYGYGGSVELFGSQSRPAFDELGAARTLAQMVVDAVLQRDRAARLVQLAARGPGQLTLGETIDSLVAATWRRPAAGPAKHAALQRVTQRAVTDAVLGLAADSGAAPDVRAMATLKLRDLQADAARRGRAAGTDVARAHWMAVERDIARWFEDGTLPPSRAVLPAPPGDPFGADADPLLDW
jgi:hypothetical protein